MVEETSLLQKVDLRNCLREVVKGSDYDSNISQYMNYESIQNKLKSFKNNTLQTTGKSKVQPKEEISSDNVPALADQVINLTMEGQTMFCDNSSMLSSGNFIIKKDDCGSLNVWMPIKDVMEKLPSQDVLNTLGMSSISGLAQDSDKFIEFKCAINGINLISAKSAGLLEN